MNRILLALTLFLALSTAPLRADPNFLFENLCSPTSLHACAGVQVFTTALSGGGTGVVIKLRNLEGVPGVNAGPSRIAELTLSHNTNNALFGEFVFPGQGPAVSISTEGTVVSTPAAQPELTWLGIPFANTGLALNLRLDALIEGGNVGNSGIAGCTNVGADYNDSPPFPHTTAPATTGDQTCGAGLSWVVFSFSTTGSWQAQDIGGVGLVFANGPQQTFAGYPNACGITYNVGAGSGTQPCVSIDPEYATTTPEPVTITLLGTGLAGMGMAARRRRAKAEKQTL